MLVQYYTRGIYYSNGLEFVFRNAHTLAGTNSTVVWTTDIWNKSADHPFDIIEINQGQHFHSQRNFFADTHGYPFIVRGVATGLLHKKIFGVFGVEYSKKKWMLKIRNLLLHGKKTLLIPEIRLTNPGGKFQPFFEGLQELLARNSNIKKLVFRRGGKVNISKEIKWWCLGNQIEIEILSPGGFDALYPDNPIDESAHVP